MTVPASPSPPGRATQLTVVGLTVAVFAAVVAFVTLQLRDGLREQILSGKAETLAAVASMQLANGAEALAEVGPEQPDDDAGHQGQHHLPEQGLEYFAHRCLLVLSY